MTAALPARARERLLAPLRSELGQLSRTPPPTVLPLSRAGWQEQSGSAEFTVPRQTERRVVRTRRSVAVVGPEEPPGHRRVSSPRVALAAENLTCLEAFIPATRSGIRGARTAMLGAALVALECASGDGAPTEVDRCRGVVDGAVAALTTVEGTFPFPDDACEAAFGVAYDDLLDAADVFSPARLARVLRALSRTGTPSQCCPLGGDVHTTDLSRRAASRRGACSYRTPARYAVVRRFASAISSPPELGADPGTTARDRCVR